MTAPLLVLLLATLVALSAAVPVPLDVGHSSGWVDVATRLAGAMNRSVDPCDNFFEFACGQWKVDHPVPPENHGFEAQTTIYQQKRDHIRGHMMDHMSQINPSNQSFTWLLRQTKMLYDGCVNNVTDVDYMELVQLLNSYGGWPVISPTAFFRSETQRTVSQLSGHLVSHYENNRQISAQLFFTGVARASGGRHELFVSPGSGLPGTQPNWDRPTFIDTATVIANGAGLNIPASQIAAAADSLDHLFERLQGIHTTPDSAHHTIASAQQAWPFINWMEYMTSFSEDTLPADFVQTQGFTVYRTKYFDALNTIFSTIDAPTMQNLLLSQVALASQSAILDVHKRADLDVEDIDEDEKDDDEVAMFPEPPKGKSGVIGHPTRQTKCFTLIGHEVPEGKYQVFAAFHDPNWPQGVLEAHRMADGVLGMWQDMIRNTSWIQPQARDTAIEKVHLASFSEFGFDQQIFNQSYLQMQYGGLHFEPTDARLMSVLKFGRYKAWKMIQMVLPNFHTTRPKNPLTVNAYYRYSTNALRFPAAGMLSEPYFENRYPKATNYAGFGFTVGHEMGHGFDPRGVFYDGHGHNTHWMDQTSQQGYNDMQRCLTDEYDHYCYVQDGETKCIHGSRSAPDNTADNAGIVAAFRAYQQRIAQTGAEPQLPGPVMSQYTMEQVFFISFGYTWCVNHNHNWFNGRWQSAGHAPEDARIMIPNMNFKAFADTFNCPAGSHMRPARPCRIWH